MLPNSAQTSIQQCREAGSSHASKVRTREISPTRPIVGLAFDEHLQLGDVVQSLLAEPEDTSSQIVRHRCSVYLPIHSY